MTRAWIAGMLLALALAQPARAADTVKIGVLKIPQTAFVALDKGYFSAEGIDVQPVFFQSGAELVPSLATGQIDVAFASAGAALFTAITGCRPRHRPPATRNSSWCAKTSPAARSRARAM